MINSKRLVPLLLLLLALIPTLCKAQCDASRVATDTETEKSLEQISSITVTVHREPDCSARVTEEYLLPFASGRTISKKFRLINEQQEVKDMSLLRNETRVDVDMPSSLKADENNQVEIRFASKKTESPVLYKLQYTITAAVTKFSRLCPESTEVGLPPDEDERSNMIRWALGSLEEVGRGELEILELSVGFVTDNKEATLDVSGHDFALNGDNPRNQTVVIDTFGVFFDRNVIVLAEEIGVAQCSEELRCFKKDLTAWQKFGKWLTSALLGLGFVVVVFLIIICWCTPGSNVIHHVHHNGTR